MFYKIPKSRQRCLQFFKKIRKTAQNYDLFEGDLIGKPKYPANQLEH